MKCEHHDEYTRLLDISERNMTTRIDAMDRRVDCVALQIHEQEVEHATTTTYVKELYRRFDDLTLSLQSVVSKLDQYITSMAVAQRDISENNSTALRGKDLVYEVIKWVLVLALGTLLGK